MNSGNSKISKNAIKQPVFLMLQGLATPFFATLAETLITTGSTVYKVNYCGGDWHFSKAAKKNASILNFQGAHNTLSEFYRHTIHEIKPSALILFGDCRPVHKAAIDVAAACGVPVYVFEEGYTRPGFVTLEKGGTNDRSPLPRTSAAIKARAAHIRQGAGQPVLQRPLLPNPMPRRVAMDLVFHAANILGSAFFRGYETHRPNTVTAELYGWLRKMLRGRLYKRENREIIRTYESGTQKYFLIPLQLNSDYQIREHSPYNDVPSFIADVIQSFAAHAPSDQHLLFKAHPLDNGMIDYRTLLKSIARTSGIESRVRYIEGGDLNRLLQKSLGAVMINSTVGYAALLAGTPLKVMGRALYDMEGLTNTQPLNSYWNSPVKPDTSLVDDFILVVRHDSQLYGDFFTREGINLAALAATKRLLADIQD